MRLKRDCNTSPISLPQSSALHIVNTGGSVISLAGSLLSGLIPLRRCDMFINLKEGENLHSFKRNSSLN